jgi:methylglyoxal synthase
MPANAPLAIGLVAHDDKKAALVDWAVAHQAFLSQHRLYATGTTGGRILQTLPDLALTRLKSGPLGGDQQLGPCWPRGCWTCWCSSSTRCRPSRTMSTSRR